MLPKGSVIVLFLLGFSGNEPFPVSSRVSEKHSAFEWRESLTLMFVQSFSTQTDLQRYDDSTHAFIWSARVPFCTTGRVWRKSPDMIKVRPPIGLEQSLTSLRVISSASKHFLCDIGASFHIMSLVILGN